MRYRKSHGIFGIVFAFVCVCTVYTVHALTLTPFQNVGVSARVGALPTIDSTTNGSQQSGVRFSGYAYPNAIVTVQKGLTKISTVRADVNGGFSVFVPEEENQLFILFATDTEGRRSTLLNFSTTLYSGYLTDITGIRFAPTIVTDKLAIKKGEYLTIVGHAVPKVLLDLGIEGKDMSRYALSANAQGVYQITIPITLPNGEYIVTIGYANDQRVSRAVKVIVGASTLLDSDSTANIPGDCNIDQEITLVDFSVLAYWYGKINPPPCIDLNKDNLVTLVDFSIMAFYWK